MKTAFKATVIAAAAIALGACASQAKPQLSLEQQLQKRDYEIIGPVERIQNYQLMGWNSLDRYNLIVLSSPSRAYLVTVKPPCNNLRFADTIGITSTAGTVTLFDSVLINENPGGFLERCWIGNLQELKQNFDKSA